MKYRQIRKLVEYRVNKMRTTCITCLKEINVSYARKHSHMCQTCYERSIQEIMDKRLLKAMPV